MPEEPFDAIALERIDQAAAELENATGDVQAAACRGDRYCQNAIASLDRVEQLVAETKRDLE